MGAAGFAAVRTQDIWWINQVTSGVKPISTAAVTNQKQVQWGDSISTETTLDNSVLA
jgi:hypothetical protein